MSIGDRLRQARKEKKLTLKALGEIVGVTGGAITAWETGRNIPNAIMMGKLAVALGVPVNWLNDVPAAAEYTISPDVYAIAKIIDSLPDKDRQTMLNVLHALGYQATEDKAEVIPGAEGYKRNRS